MTQAAIRRALLTLSDADRLAAELGSCIRAGDMITLTGPLGAGKTTLARALIRHLTGAPDEDVPSPTFTLVQTYDHARIPVWHFDLYRLDRADEIFELGFEEAESDGLSLVEWPDRMGTHLPADYLSIHIDDEGGPEMRHAVLSSCGNWTDRLSRMDGLREFLDQAGWGMAERNWLQGDASARAYERLELGGRRAVLMNAPPVPDGPPIRDGKSYSRIAHLAENMRPFSAMTGFLRSHDLSAPEILAQDFGAGFLLIEDLGDNLFAERLRAGKPMDDEYRVAVDVLVKLRRVNVPPQLPIEGHKAYRLPEYDREAMMIELDLLTAWFWPKLHGKPMPEAIRRDYEQAWGRALDQLSGEQTLVMRDYHSPNLLWLPDRTGAGRAGLIDFQDAVLGPPAYDLVSLLQDARVDIPQAREHELRSLYLSQAGLEGEDAQALLADYALMGAQRASKILGIFMRLCHRDGKPGYLAHIPRVSAYLERNLRHPALAELGEWFSRHLPEQSRII